ncbi:MAG: hypothetical protein IPM46_07190 [Flavobacteriales bacterium]|nr:hypothetical protein [Flavobacteriales bacterium]
MPEMSDNDLRKLFQAAGHGAPSRDLSERIMARVAVTRIAEPTAVQPLISKRGWAGIAGAVLLLSIGLMLGTSASSVSYQPLPILDEMLVWMKGLQLPAGQWPQWVIGASLLAMLFVVLDRVAERRAAA